MSTLPTPRTDVQLGHAAFYPHETVGMTPPHLLGAGNLPNPIITDNQRIEQLERELAEAKAERDALKAEVERLLIQNRSQQELGDAIVECASRSLGVIRKDTTVFGEYSHRSCVEISLRNIEEMGREITDPGVSKWGRKDAQDVHRNTHAQFVRCEADLSRWRALAEELAGALDEYRYRTCPTLTNEAEELLARYRAASADGHARKEEAP